MKPYLKYGLIVGATGILLSMITYVTGLDKSDTGQYLNYINIPITIIAMVFAIKERRDKELGGFIEFGQGFGTAALLVVIASVISSVYTYFYMAFINPSFHEFLMQKQEAKMEERGMSQESIDAALKMAGKFMTPGMVSMFALLGGILVGILIALIVAAIMRKANPNPFDSTVVLDK
jgi:hypothetical protein